MDDEGAQETTLYRFYADDQLVYVGITCRLPFRWKEHHPRDWWRECTRTTLTHFASRAEALAAEEAAIREEKPTYNIQHAHYDPPPREQEYSGMTRVTSTDFRLAYSSLTEPTEVTVLGRVIGRWIPTEYGRYYEPTDATGGNLPEPQAERVAALEAEIRYLKGELAARLTTKIEPNVHAPNVAVRAGKQPGFGHPSPAKKPGS